MRGEGEGADEESTLRINEQAMDNELEERLLNAAQKAEREDVVRTAFVQYTTERNIRHIRTQTQKSASHITQSKKHQI